MNVMNSSIQITSVFQIIRNLVGGDGTPIYTNSSIVIKYGASLNSVDELSDLKETNQVLNWTYHSTAGLYL